MLVETHMTNYFLNKTKLMLHYEGVNIVGRNKHNSVPSVCVYMPLQKPLTCHHYRVCNKQMTSLITHNNTTHLLCKGCNLF